MTKTTNITASLLVLTVSVIVGTIALVPYTTNDALACSGDECDVIQFKLGYQHPCANSGLLSSFTCTTWKSSWTDIAKNHSETLTVDVDDSWDWVKPMVKTKYKYNNVVYATWSGEWYLEDGSTILDNGSLSIARYYHHGHSVDDRLSSQPSQNADTLYGLFTVHTVLG